MSSSYQIGKIIGIPIKIHISFLIILPLFAWFFSVQTEPLGFSGVEPELMKYVLSLLTAILLFASVLAHELAHSFFTIRYGGSIREIRLYLIGGVAAMEKEVNEPLKEAKMTFAGPLSSIIIGILLLSVNYAFNKAPVSEGNPLFLMIFILGYINIILGLFNLLPAYPMDGGRILRAFLATRMNFVKATEKSATIGKTFAVLMAILGFLGNPWLILIAAFVFIGASKEEKQVKRKYDKY